MSVTVSYSHPLPFILNKAAYAVYAAETSETQRAKREYYGQAYAYVDSARILIDSDETKDAARGIANSDSLPTHAVAWLADFIGDEGIGRDLMGEQYVTAKTRPSRERSSA